MRIEKIKKISDHIEMHYVLIAAIFLLSSGAWSKTNSEVVRETNLEFQQKVEELNKRYEDFFVHSQEVERERLRVKEAAHSHKVFREETKKKRDERRKNFVRKKVAVRSRLKY